MLNPIDILNEHLDKLRKDIARMATFIVDYARRSTFTIDAGDFWHIVGAAVRHDEITLSKAAELTGLPLETAREMKW